MDNKCYGICGGLCLLGILFELLGLVKKKAIIQLIDEGSNQYLIKYLSKNL